jgi:hypothetical protein
MSVMPRVAGLKPGPAALARRGVAGVCVALLVAGCAPGSHGRSGTPAAFPGAGPGGGGPADPAAAAVALARGRWSVLAASPLGSRQGPVVAWTGTELLEIGGTGRTAAPGEGAAFDPADGRWRRIAPAPMPAGAAAAASVWTGSRLFVFGVGPLPGKTTLGPAAALYDPASGSWAVTATAPFGTGLRQPAAVRAGRLVVVAGVDGSRVEVASYDPATGRWRRQDPPLPAAHPALGIAMAAAAGRVIAWSLWGRMQQAGPDSVTGYSGIDVRALAGGRWRDVSGGWPQQQTVPPPLVTGRQILVPPGQIWCGACSHPAVGLPGLLADPGTLRITRLPRGPLDDTGPVMVWTGGAALAIDMNTEISGPGVNLRPGDMAAWDPASGAWRRLPGAPRPPQCDATPVWTGHELLAIATDGALLSFTP